MKLSEGLERLGGIEHYRVEGKRCKCCGREQLYAMHAVFIRPGVHDDPTIPADHDMRKQAPPTFWAWCGNCGSLNSLVHDGLMSPTSAAPS